MAIGNGTVRGKPRRGIATLLFQNLINWITKKWKIFSFVAALLLILTIGHKSEYAKWGPTYPLDSPRLVAQEMDSDEFLDMDQYTTKLWEHIKTAHIIPPSTLPYSFPNGVKNDTPLKFIDKSIDHVLLYLFWNKTGGVFVEVGAFDGWYSHTLIWEAYMRWTGLLIECHPTLLPTLKSVNRKAHIADVCLSKTVKPEKGRLTSPDEKPDASSLASNSYFFPEEIITNYTVFEVQTVPLFAILAALEMMDIDLFILDVNGLETEVIRSLPFERVNIKVVVVDVELMDINRQFELRSVMEERGYSKDRFWHRGYKQIFVHESFEIMFPNAEAASTEMLKIPPRS